MNEFKSDIFESIAAKGLRNGVLIFILYLTSSIIDCSGFTFTKSGLFEFVLVYLALFVVQIFFTNNDLKIEGEEVVIQSSLIPYLRKKEFQKSEIEEITFKDEWIESFMKKRHSSIIRFVILYFILIWLIPWEYKWMQIKTKNNKKFKYYFFGINYDFHDNSGGIIFEDMFLELAKRNISVKWKSTKDDYFNHLQKTADEIMLNLNKKTEE